MKRSKKDLAIRKELIINSKSTKELREKEHQKDLERLRALRPMDDDFMRAMLKENKSLAEFILRILMNDPGLVLESFTTQADMKRVTGARSVVLDGYGTDAEGRKFDIEVQCSDSGAAPQRAFYNLSSMAVENLDAGQDFTELPELFTIFITERDVFGKEKSIDHYEFKNADGDPLKTGANIMYVNGEYDGSDDVGFLMHDLNCSDPDQMHFKEMSQQARYLKENPKGVSKMCKVLEEMKDEARNAGREEGREEGRKEGRQEGLEQGLEKGMERGLEKGMERGLEKGILGTIDILRENNIPDEDIIRRVVNKFKVSETYVRDLMNSAMVY